jgi:SNF2 family DNA or RNA helicase
MDDGAFDKFLLDASVLHLHQKTAIEWMMKSKQGVILADEMGLGKTLSVLGFGSSMKMRDKNFRALIVAPLSVAPNWVAETKRFTSFTSTLLLGDAEEREKIQESFVSDPTDLLITTYEYAREG